MFRTGWLIFIVLLLALGAWWFWPRTPVQAPQQEPAGQSVSTTTSPSGVATTTQDLTQTTVAPKEFATRSESHLKAIESEDLSILSDDYEPDAVLHWVGGALAGEYNGKEAVMGVWQKFFDGNEIRGYEFKNRFTQNRTVTIDVIFIVFREGAVTRIPVKQVIRFNDDKKIVEETWQVEPSLLDQGAGNGQ